MENGSEMVDTSSSVKMRRGEEREAAITKATMEKPMAWNFRSLKIWIRKYHYQWLLEATMEKPMA